VVPKDYMHTDSVPLTDATRQNALKALELEALCEAFYRCCEENAQTRIAETYFRRLARHEEHHKQELARLLAVEEPELPMVECPASDKQKYLEAVEKERMAIAHYELSFEQATEERAMEIFVTFADVEMEHKMVAMRQGANANL